MPERLTLTQMRGLHADLIDRVERGARAIVTRRDKDIVAIVPMADLERLAALDNDAVAGKTQRRRRLPLTAG